MIETGRLPRGGRVAKYTLSWESSGDVIRVWYVCIFTLVTRDAC